MQRFLPVLVPFVVVAVTLLAFGLVALLRREGLPCRGPEEAVEVPAEAVEAIERA